MRFFISTVLIAPREGAKPRVRAEVDVVKVFIGVLSVFFAGLCRVVVEGCVRDADGQIRSAASATAASTDTDVATATRTDPVTTTAGAVAVAAETEAMYTVGRKVWRRGSSAEGGDIVH